MAAAMFSPVIVGIVRKRELLCTPETPTPGAPQYGASGYTETCGI